MKMFLAMLAFEMLHISIDTIDISMGETPPGAPRCANSSNSSRLRRQFFRARCHHLAAKTRGKNNTLKQMRKKRWPVNTLSMGHRGSSIIFPYVVAWFW